MPLSDREQQLLKQMERALLEEDPSFATSMRGGPGRARHRRRLAIGIGGVVVGLGTVLFGVSQFGTTGTVGIVIGAIGFALMVGAVIYAVTERRPRLHAVATTDAAAKQANPNQPKGSGKKRSGSGPSFMDKMEQRWEERRDDGGF